MKILQGIIQGSPEWQAIRAKCNTASEASAMMGASKYQTRNDLLKQKASGLVPEVDDFKQKLFDKGHAAEAAARSIAESIIGGDLFPVTCTDDDGYLLASLDGLTMLGDTVWEHKLWNESLAEAVRAKNLGPDYYWQLEHQLLVTGANSVIFMVSDGTAEKCVWMEYKPVAGRAAQLMAGWAQFEKDVAAYTPEAIKPAAIAETIDALPALTVQLVGQVTSSNLATFQTVVLERIKAINTTLVTDADFATADKMVKFLEDGEKRLDLVKSQALSQTASIDELFRTIDGLKAEMKNKRLTLDKLVKAEKENRKTEIVNEAKLAFNEHYSALCDRVGVAFSVVYVGFAEVIKGLKSLDSIRDKVSVALANAKIEASAIADRIDTNHKTVEDMTLFPDFASVCTKAPDDFAALLAMRISQRQESEAKRLEGERERIRQEEQAKAKREAEQKAQMAEHERLVAERARIRAEESAKVAAEPVAKPLEVEPTVAVIAEAKPVAITSGTKTSSRLTTDEMRRRINARLDSLDDFQLLNVLAYVEGHFIAHAA
jgi:putative phage-type endonuclease